MLACIFFAYSLCASPFTCNVELSYVHSLHTTVVHSDFMELKQMLEKIGQPKTHLECKKMIKEVNKRDTDTINYREFLDMMLGSKNSVLRL